MLPAYVPNSAAAAVGGGMPIDLGKTRSDGTRLFGDGKTIRGFFGGVACGCLIGGLQIIAQGSSALSFLPQHTPLSVILLATGALVGDMVKSFFKRRAGIERGASWPFVDQYDFVAGAFAFLIIGAPAFALSSLTLPVILTILILTPVLHRVVNIIGYKLGVKDVPW
ncbi:MAG: CDP-2,3-bis-(O-geranylgeranyl)-sn-glycerol synthase [Methanospirillum sp.]|uniref:CDP-2,3-bis-(O-geranylgeranyl)-sn-glycerol synthase n=1 Tax=Methanospirillum sp. TaxID=45200 RepID=UPI0023721DC4|nr:CDP-2,3-bis-(O-geranylgeranyl)-sn-glycerol synthase [Methanospirillum sp.]MDD1730477.1 CDP-2,3-bis-(O-geranylgeranyl)-sn-glycerol synthase [Methanospirillum sp.]